MKIKSFTRYLEEESTGYAKLKSKKFRKIRFNDAEKAIMTDEENAAIAGVSMYIKNNPDKYEESYFKAFDELKTRRTFKIKNKKDFEVFYSFSNAIRGNRRYGNSNWSARFLYEFLCVRFNGGERFVDTYLERLFPSRPVFLLMEALVEKVQTDIETKWNDGELRGGQWTAFYKFQSAEMDYLRKALERFSREIRQDIILCLSTGLVPLRFSLAQATINKRLSLGLKGDSAFYATSWLINQLEVHVVLGDAAGGNLFYSDSYGGKS
jgi:hypothetical protein